MAVESLSAYAWARKMSSVSSSRGLTVVPVRADDGGRALDFLDQIGHGEDHAMQKGLAFSDGIE